MSDAPARPAGLTPGPAVPSGARPATEAAPSTRRLEPQAWQSLGFGLWQLVLHSDPTSGPHRRLRLTAVTLRPLTLLWQSLDASGLARLDSPAPPFDPDALETVASANGSAERAEPGVLNIALSLPPGTEQVVLHTLIPPAVLHVQWVDLARHGATHWASLPGCGQRATLRPASPPSPDPAQLLAELDGLRGAPLIGAAARALLADDAPATSLAVLRVLAQQARLSTPDGLIDLMVHLGSSHNSGTACS